jgi:hypothetical protein
MQEAIEYLYAAEGFLSPILPPTYVVAVIEIP